MHAHTLQIQISVKDDNFKGGLGMCEPNDFDLIWELKKKKKKLTEKALFQVILGLLLVNADWEKGVIYLRVCVCFMT